MTVLPLGSERITVGRAPDNGLVVNDAEVSRYHCAIEPFPGGHRLLDLESRNGTFLNGRQVQQVGLEAEDRICFGRRMAVYVSDEADAAQALAKSRELFLPWADDVKGLGEEETALTSKAAKTSLYLRPTSLEGLRDMERQQLLVRVSLLGVGVSTQFDVCRLMDAILDELVAYTGCDRAMLVLLDGRTGHAQAVLGRGARGGALSPAHRTYPEDLVEQAFLDASPTVHQHETPEGTTICLSLRSSVQLTLRERRQTNVAAQTLGVIVLMGTSGIRKITVEDSWLLEAVSVQAAAALRHARLFHMATTDVLTGLYNRDVTEQVLAEEVGAHRPFGLILLDLDHFKRVNDELGHGVGDEVLARAAQRMRRAVRRGDHVCRWGGEEFLLFLPGQDLAGTVRVARKLSWAIGGSPIGEQRVRVTASMGVSVHPLHGRTPADLIEHADQALYGAKTSGRDRIRVFGSELTPIGGACLGSA